MTTDTATTPGTTTAGTREPVDFWFDATCPWAWMSSRWVLEVEKVRDIEVRWHMMSLSVLNEGRELAKGYQALMDKAWLPARAAVQVRERHGAEALGPWYTAVGTRIHEQGRTDYEAVVAEALEELGHDADILDAARTDVADEQLRASQKEAEDLVGNDVGTPVVAFNGTAFFGPVMTRIPRGEEAGRIFDGAVALADFPYFYEIKRARTTDPQFD